jgi:hypothetical protein
MVYYLAVIPKESLFSNLITVDEFINFEDFDMKYIKALLSFIRPTQLLLPILFSAIMLFTSSCAAQSSNNRPEQGMTNSNNRQQERLVSGKSSPTKGTVQLNEIEKKAQEAIDSPATSLKTIEERSQGSLNEIQGDGADLSKMNRSNDSKLPVVKQTEKALSKMKNG